jgi:DNA-binding transcriptional MocR family regulator
MLRKFLRLAFGRDTTDTTDLARELGVSVQQVRLMMETLERQGYLEKVAAGSEQSCDRCAMHPTCLLTDCPSIWRLTPKGERCLADEREPLK